MSRGIRVAAQSSGREDPQSQTRRRANKVWEDSVAKEDRGFASMDRVKQKEIASKGGKAAHQKGTAHEWTSEEAREAGRKGGMASHRRRMVGSDQSGDAANAGSSEASPSLDERSGSNDDGELIR